MSLDSICLAFAQIFLKEEHTSWSQRLPLSVIGNDNQESTTRVSEILLTISKEQFEDSAWELLGKNLYYAKVKTTCCLRRLESYKDCSRLEMGSKSLKLHFRISAFLATQRPQTFAPLYNKPFHQLHEVPQGEMALTHPRAQKPCLATWHLAWCIAFIAYDKIHQVGLLAHTDEWTEPHNFYAQIKGALSALTSEPVSLDYVLLGGATKEDIESLKAAGEHASDSSFQFRCIKEITLPDLEHSFAIDSGWGVSMRLARSVVLDTTASTPLEHLMSYEPLINSGSSLHRRAFTLEEKLSFEKRRASQKVLDIWCEKKAA